MAASGFGEGGKDGRASLHDASRCSTTLPISACASLAIHRQHDALALTPRNSCNRVTDGYVRLSLGIGHEDDI